MKLKVVAKESWKKVLGTQSYFVSSLGRVKTVKNGREHIQKLYERDNGYLSCNVYYEGVQKTKEIHILVAEAFLGERPSSQYVINHIDGNKTNNHLSNLEYITYAENTQHAFDTGLNVSGENHPNSTISNKQVVLMKFLIKLGYSDKDIAERFEIAQRTVNRIRHNQSRKREVPIFSTTVVPNLGDKTLKTAFDSDCPKGKVPCVIFHKHGTSKDYISLNLDDFFKLVPCENIVRRKD